MSNQIEMANSMSGIIQIGFDKTKNSSSMVALGKFKTNRSFRPVSFNFPARHAGANEQVQDSTRQINLVAMSSTTAAGIS